MALKLLPVFVFMLLWLLFPASAEWTSSTNTSCIRKILQSGCDVATVDNSTACCSSIVRETMSSEVCMCSAFGSDANFVDGFTMYCGSSINSILVFCPDATLLTSPPITNTSSPAPPLTSNTSSLVPPPTSNTSSPAPPTNSTTPSFSNDTSGKKSNGTIIAVVVVILVVIVIIVIAFICIRKRKNKIKQNNPSNDYEKSQKGQGSLSASLNGSSGNASLSQTPISNVSRGWNPMNFKKAEIKPEKMEFKFDDSSEYDLATLKEATDNFSYENKIGRGGFGDVFKGVLPNGQKIAVKRLSKDSGQGDIEFKAEIERLAKLKHKNLVQLLGYCLVKGEESLVYELVVNKSLDYFLFGGENKRPEELNWSTRFEIIRGIAKGLVYLHAEAPQQTVHRDLKAANVLLDEKMNPKIADFGLARKCVPDQTYGITKRPMGTDGYMAPEYLHNAERFSFKTDVYAFGVLVLEIISGKRVNSVFNYHSEELGEKLLSYAWRCWDDKKPLAIVDPLLKDSFVSDEVIKCIQLGLLCVQDESIKRPDMSTIVQILNFNPELAVLDTPRCPQSLLLGGPVPFTSSSTEQSATDSSGAISSSAKSDFKNPR